MAMCYSVNVASITSRRTDGAGGLGDLSKMALLADQLQPDFYHRVAVVLVAVGTLLAVAATAGGAAAVTGHTVRANASGNLVNNAAGAAGLAQGAVSLWVLASLLVWLAVQVPRYRRSTGERRQQFKWLYTGATLQRRPDRSRIRLPAAGRHRSRLGPRGPGRCRAESPAARPRLRVDERTRRNWLSHPWPLAACDDGWRRSRAAGRAADPAPYRTAASTRRAAARITMGIADVA